MIFPGVPIIMWGLLFNIFIWLLRSSPPTITAVFKPISAPNALRCSDICTHNYLVGERIIAKYGIGLNQINYYFYSNFWMMGNAKARVLPLPVSANAIISLPFNV